MLLEVSFDVLLIRGENPQIKINARTLSAMNQFFLAIVKLRKSFDYQTLSDTFGLSKTTVGKNF